MFGSQNNKKENNDNNDNSSNNEVVGFNFLEFDKQRREELLKKKNIKIEIIVSKDEEPYIQVKNSNVPDSEVARMLVAIDIVKDDLINRCPTAIMKAHFIKHSIASIEIPIKGDDDNNAKRKL